MNPAISANTIKNDPNLASEKHPPARLGSMDAYRGFVMFLMMAEVLPIDRVASAFPKSSFWKLLAFHTEHVDWTGCSLHDMIQPSFSFLVGVALPYSIASRRARGQSDGAMIGHAIWRSFMLAFLGIFLRSAGARTHLNFNFMDTLTQIGFGYSFLFFIGLRSIRFQWIAFGVILFGTWLAWSLHPLPPPDFDFTKVFVPADWPYHAKGFAAHWNKNFNLGTTVDQWWVNLFPRDNDFKANDGGYTTINFIPTLATMILGLIVGGWCRNKESNKQFLTRLVIIGTAFILAGLAIQGLGLCPIVKRIWTPSWVFFSGGICFLMLSAFYLLVDVWGFRRCAFPLMVIGMNSIAAYCIAHWFEGFINNSLKTCFGHSWPLIFGPIFEPLMSGAGILLGFWLMLFWMYRRKLFVRI